jgi:N-acyl-D-aspartate/D-glutamate deacylase
VRVAIDVVFRGATIHDGSGGPPRTGDVGVAAGRIVAVDPDSIGPATRRIDAGGLVLAPGFIDLHSHADCTLPAFPGAINSISQGVTTEVIGNCGFSPAPVSPIPERANELRLQAGAIARDLAWDWTDFGSFLARLDQARPAHNVVALVGHGTLRVAAMGMDDRAPTSEELGAMRGDLDRALASGAWGMSTGLVYPPGTYAATDEVIAVGEALRSRDAIYASHIRNEGDELPVAIDEALEIGRALGMRVEISHLKSAGIRNHGGIGRALERIDAARAEGVRATFDMYPYTAGSTMLTQALPPWLEDGGMEQLIERLASSEVRARVRRELEKGLPGFPNYAIASGGWQNLVIATVGDPSLRWAEGRSIAELATERGVDPLDLTYDLLVADRAATVMIIFMMADSDVRAAIAHPAAGVGSDQLGVTSDTARGHPRCYGTFARLLAWAARGDGPLDLADTIHRMTGHAADVLKLPGRGRIEPGAVADLVAFDPSRVRDAATYAEPTRLAEGIEHVLIGGSFALDGGVVVARDLGRVLRPR